MTKFSRQIDAETNRAATEVLNELKLGELASPHGRMAVLLSRYPHVSGSEAEELVTFIRSARKKDIAVIVAIETLRPQFERFIKDNQRHLDAPASEFLWIAVASLLILAICGFLWDQRPHPLSPLAPTTNSSAS